ncbi:MAG TPA: alpha/beta hydrolase [Bacteroidia bacterium]|jgi:acetyl esterase/lipase|nr:alpha/beta hydrolase [Bacteroidia bacterium]
MLSNKNNVIALTVSLLLLFISLLAVFHAPTYLLWKLTVAVTEFPHAFMAAALLCLIIPRTGTTQAIVSYSINAIALLLFCTPLLRAQSIISDLPAELNTAFIHQQSKESPYGFLKMLQGNSFAEMPFHTLVYGQRPQKDLTLDFYAPSRPSRKPCIVVIHGGSWSSGDSRQLPALNSYLAGKGYPVAAINYSLAPGAIYPAQVQDTRKALEYLKAHAKELQIDADDFVLLGRSAGGQIALTAAYTFGDPAIKGVIAYYAPADMIWGYSVPGNPLIMDSRKVMEDYLGGTYEQAKSNFYDSSPIEFAGAGSPPTLLIHGRRDELVAWEHSRRLNEKLKANGVPHFLLTLPWATHGCDFNLSGPSGQLSTYAVEAFLNNLQKS